MEVIENTEYSDRFHKQVWANASYITDPQDTPNLLYSGISEAEWIYNYEQSKLENPSIEDCANDTRLYYNGL